MNYFSQKECSTANDPYASLSGVGAGWLTNIFLLFYSLRSLYQEPD
jgi:hypothetical protein